jgi:hypothetical protein
MVARARGRRIRDTDGLSKEQLDWLRAKDFLGQLTPEEEELARRIGVYKWDGYVKRQRAQLGRHGKVEP